LIAFVGSLFYILSGLWVARSFFKKNLFAEDVYVSDIVTFLTVTFGWPVVLMNVINNNREKNRKGLIHAKRPAR
jgi:hypothetical protein